MQHDRYQLRYGPRASRQLPGDAPAALVSEVARRRPAASLWAQDLWRFAPGWSAVLGGRAERWEAIERD